MSIRIADGTKMFKCRLYLKKINFSYPNPRTECHADHALPYAWENIARAIQGAKKVEGPSKILDFLWKT